MKILILTWSARDVFIYNFTKWLKTSLPACEIDIFERADSGNAYYDLGDFAKVYRPGKCKSLFERKFRKNEYVVKETLEFLKGRHYDIIQCHGIVQSMVMNNRLKEHCGALVATFWGGEMDRMRIHGSHKRFMKTLGTWLERVDVVVNSPSVEKTIRENFGASLVLPRFDYAQLGAAAMDCLMELVGRESRQESKRHFGLDPSLATVVVGYSGKAIHRHVDIIREIARHPSLSGRVEVFLVMTRGLCSEKYLRECVDELEKGGIKYTVLAGRYLSDEEVAQVRNATDYVLQFSDYDGFSRSLVEFMTAGATMIYGSWLNYTGHLSRLGYEAFETSSIADGMALLESFVTCEEAAKTLSGMQKKNRASGSALTWRECIKDWVKLYEAIS